MEQNILPAKISSFKVTNARFRIYVINKYILKFKHQFKGPSCYILYNVYAKKLQENKAKTATNLIHF